MQQSYGMIQRQLKVCPEAACRGQVSKKELGKPLMAYALYTQVVCEEAPDVRTYGVKTREVQ